MSTTMFGRHFIRIIPQRVTLVVRWLLVLAFSTFAARAAEPDAKTAGPTPEQIEFFEKHVRPVFAGHCLDCHCEGTAESKLRVDSLEGLLKGGTRGPAVVPGKPAESLLISAVNHGEVLQMPPKEKLTPREIADLTAWIKSGAAWPNSRSADQIAAELKSQQSQTQYSDEQRNFWSFRTPATCKLPKVSDEIWVRTPIDYFILSALEAKKLKPAPEADRRTLIRRATFDLIGLPPTPEEVEAFIKDDSPHAYERLIERLLASPHYGERWGRHWLDVARYADSNGMDENIAFGSAFRYRDYVIAAFNKDKPYDRFIHEQIAGDLLAPKPNETEAEYRERLIATGFLAIGPKMLADDDPVKKQMDIVDEQIDTTCKAFMGLTMGCARCHDHKFDPLPATDYYALAGIFKSTKTMETLGVVAQWHEYDIPTPDESARVAAHEQKVKEFERRIAQRVEAAREEYLAGERNRAGRYLLAASMYLNRAAGIEPDGTHPIGDFLTTDSAHSRGVLLEAENFQRGTVQVDTTNWGKDVGVLLQSGYAEYDIELPQAGAYQLELRYAAQDARPLEISVNGKRVKIDGAGQVTGGWFAANQEWRVEGVFEFKAGHNVVRLERFDVFPHIDKILIARMPEHKGTSGPAEPAIAARGIHAWATDLSLNEVILAQWIDSLRKLATPTDSFWKGWLNAEAQRKLEGLTASTAADATATLTKRADEYQALFDQAAAAWDMMTSGGAKPDQASDPRLAAFHAIEHAADGPFRLADRPERFFPMSTAAEIDRMIKEKEALVAAKPEISHAMGVREGEVQDVRIHLRGSHLTLGAEVGRRFVGVIAGADQPKFDKSQSGRLQFADWLTSSKHPLTSRVMVNRIWRWHFGTGLVRSPDNFGTQGESPTNQPLLDWLAVEFMREGWSIKTMHRLIMLSSTYRMSSRHNVEAAAADPENTLYWHMPRRRLEAEEIRDTLLALGNRLDVQMDGQLLKDKNRDYVTGTGSKVNTYDFVRRSVYLPVLRSAVYEVLQAFDFADPSTLNGERATTTVTPQALFMMNGSVVSENAQGMADDLLQRRDLDDAARINLAFLRAYGRAPQPKESEKFLAFAGKLETECRKSTTDETEAKRKAWRSLCRVIIASNELIYVE